MITLIWVEFETVELESVDFISSFRNNKWQNFEKLVCVAKEDIAEYIFKNFLTLQGLILRAIVRGTMLKWSVPSPPTCDCECNLDFAIDMYFLLLGVNKMLWQNQYFLFCVVYDHIHKSNYN